MKNNISIEEALDCLLDFTLPASFEKVSLENAYQRILAQDVKTPFSVPISKSSALDGYAINKEDLEGQNTLTCLFDLEPGQLPSQGILKGQTMRVATGGVVPEGTSAIIGWEQVEINENKVSLKRSLKDGDNVKPKGEDYLEGEIAFLKGKQLSFGDLGILASFNFSEIMVYAMPKVSIFCLSPEIISPFKAPKAGQIRDANSLMVSSLLKARGAILEGTYYLSDYPLGLDSKLQKAFKTSDLILTIGGAAANSSDIALGLLRKAGVDMQFWGMKSKPGSHSGGGIKDHTLVISLSGNPGACMVGYQRLVVPALKAMQGLEPKPLVLKMPCNQDYPRQGGPRRFLRGKLVFDQNLSVDIFPKQKSSMLCSFSSCDALIELEAGHSPLKAGDLVKVHPLNY